MSILENNSMVLQEFPIKDSGNKLLMQASHSHYARHVPGELITIMYLEYDGQDLETKRDCYNVYQSEYYKMEELSMAIEAFYERSNSDHPECESSFARPMEEVIPLVNPKYGPGLGGILQEALDRRNATV